MDWSSSHEEDAMPSKSNTPVDPELKRQLSAAGDDEAEIGRAHV